MNLAKWLIHTNNLTHAVLFHKGRSSLKQTSGWFMHYNSGELPSTYL